MKNGLKNQCERSPRVRAFTIIEMLVVVSIVVILIVLAVPGFQAMIKGTEETLADNQLKAGMRAARDVAVRSGPGTDAAAVFFFTDEGRLQIVACVRAGLVRDLAFDAQGNQSTVEREVFVAASGVQAVQLPKHWNVRGYAPPGYVETNIAEGWYSSSGVGSGVRYDGAIGNWVFPETAFFNPDRSNEGPLRSTFMVRFAGGTGRLVTSNVTPVLVLAPGMSPAGESTVTGAPAGLSDWRRRIGEDPAGYAQKVLQTKMTAGTNSVNYDAVTSQRQRLVGRLSTDMVLVRPVTQVALCDETRMAADIGARLGRTVPALIEYSDQGSGGPQFVALDSGGSVTSELVNRWIEGDSNGDRVYGDENDRVESKVYVFDRYTGSLRRAEVQREQVQ